MNLEQITFDVNQWIVPAGFIIAGIIIGFVVEKIFLYNLKKMAVNNRWEGGRIVVNSLRGVTFLWFIIAGLYFALLNAPDLGRRFFTHFRLALAIIVIASITYLVAKLSTGFVKLYTGKVLPSTSIFTNLTKVFVFVLGGLVILQTVGISVAPILTALGVGGLAVALALQDTLSNLFAGLHIIASKKIKTGDYVKLESGGEGILEDITWRNTAIKTLSNNTIIIPNSKMASSIVINYNIPAKSLDLTIPLAVGYTSDLNKVETITLEVAREVIQSNKGALPEQEPAVRFNAFQESSISLNVTIKIKEFTDQGLVKHEFIKKIHDRYHKEKIEIPYPTRTVHIDHHSE